jgi:hypothetical protein
LSNSDKWTYISIFATWCEACGRDLPKAVQDCEELAPTISCIGIDEREDTVHVLHFVTKYGFTFPVGLDHADFGLKNEGTIDARRRYLLYGHPGAFGVVAENAGVSYLPAHCLIDPNGHLRALWYSTAPGTDQLRIYLKDFALLPLATRQRGVANYRSTTLTGSLSKVLLPAMMLLGSEFPDIPGSNIRIELFDVLGE